MVAIVSGNGLGLINSSAGVLGQQGMFGNAAQGASKEGAYINVANGNLLLQDRDDFLAARGINLALTRTYNSLGAVTSSSSGNDWLNGLVTKVGNLSGAVNTQDSSIRRIDGDGSVSLFKYDAVKGYYVSTDGGGAYQTMSYASGVWTWKNDRNDLNGLVETYDAATGLIKQRSDQTGTNQTYTFSAGRLQSIVDKVYDPKTATLVTLYTTSFAYDGNGNLSKVTNTPASGSGNSIAYTYDASNRLQSYEVDLTPDITTDKKVYVTTYSYDDAKNGNGSHLISGITQTVKETTTVSAVTTVKTHDESRQAFKYDSAGRVIEYTEYASATDLTGRTTKFDYAGLVTTVTDPLGNVTAYGYDASGQLTSVTGPSLDGVQQQTSFSYDTDGNLKSSTDARGLRTDYEYDGNGNCIRQHDAAGNTITRSFAAGSNKLLTETSYRTASDSWTPKLPQTTRYVYDTANRLRYVVSPEGRVTEYVYPTAANTLGTGLVAQLNYSDERHYTTLWKDVPADADVAAKLADLDSWRLGEISGKRYTAISYTYDNRGLMTASSTVNADGATAVTTTQFSYDRSGRLISSTDSKSTVVTYAYDGLGRQLSKTVKDSTGTLLHQDVTTYATDKLAMTVSSGDGTGTATTTYAYDQTGRLLSLQQPGVGQAIAYVYDSDGRLYRTTSAGGRASYQLYDAAGRQVGMVDASGALTELVYNNDSQVIKTIRYTNLLTAARLEALGKLDSDGYPPVTDFATLRDSVTGNDDLSTWNFYNVAGLLADIVDADGNITHYEYDGAGRPVRATARDTALTADALTSLKKTSNADLAALSGIAQSSSTNDRSSYKLYDKDGRLGGQVDAQGYLIEFVYNGAGLLVDTIRYANKALSLPTSSTAVGIIRPATSGDDLHAYRIYDAQGRLTGSIDSDGFLTELAYDTLGNVSTRTTYAFASNTPGAETLAAVKAGITVKASNGTTNISVASSPDNRVVSYTYNGLGQLKTETTSAPGTTAISYEYDSNGQLVKSIRSNGTTSVASYDGRGNLLTEAASSNAPNTTYTYDADGLRTSMTDPNGNLTTYHYDKAGRLSYTVDGSGSVQRNQYDNFGRVSSVTRYATPLDSGLNYDKRQAQLASLSVASSQTTAYRYDADGRLWYTVAPDNSVTSNSYNAFGQLKTTVRYGTLVSDKISISDVLKSTSGNNTSYYSYDEAGRLSYTIDAAGNAIGKTYDAFGRTGTVTHYTDKTTGGQLPAGGSNDRTETYGYNKRGLVTDYADGEQKHTLTAYDAYGHVVRVQRVASSGGKDSITRTIYNEDGHVAATVDALGALTVFQYDGDGNVTDRISYSTLLLADGSASDKLLAIDKLLLKGLASTGNTISANDIVAAVTAMATAAPAQDVHQIFKYDSRGRQVLSATATAASSWSITTQSYDDNDQLYERTTYATKLSATLATVAAATDLSTITPKSAASDARVRLFYDQDGRVTDTLTAQSSGNWAVVSQQYDAFGNLLQQTAYSAVLNLANPAASDLASFKTNNAVNQANAVTVFRYDSMNRLKYKFIAQNTVTVKLDGGATANMLQWSAHANNYDAAGNIKDTIDYATAVLTTPGSTPAAVPTEVADSDRKTAYEYDGAGRPTKITDAGGAVSKLEYDGRGNVIKRTEQGSPSDRVTRTQYDLNDRPKLVADAAGAVTELRYDAFGNVVTRIQYATRIKASDALAAPASDPANDRTTTYVYDQDQQLRFSIDGSGYITENQYDALGRVSQRLTYPNLLTRTDNKLATLIATVAGATGVNAPRGTTYTYDAQGNVLTATDKLGFAEKYSYDALGRKLSYTNQLSNVWSYTYDGAGRLLTETSPAVSVYPSSGATADTKPLADPAVGLVTRYKYDTLGNLLSRTEAAGTVQERSTGYGYDLVGRQVQTTQQALAVYDAKAAAAVNDPNRTESAAATHSINVVYDMQGNAIANTDVGGATSYKVYDKLGQVRYDIDALGYVTGYERNAFGDVITLTRYADKLPGYDDFIKDTSKLTAAAVKDALVARKPAGPDRAVVTEYDQMGRASKVTEPQVTVYDQYGINGQFTYQSARTTETSYNAFGDIILQSVYGAYKLAKDVTGKTAAANTRYYYNQSGLKKAQINALQEDASGKRGYLTTYTYDGAGNLLTQLESATEIATWDDKTYASAAVNAASDRQLSYAYDGGNRKTSETRVQAQSSATFGSAGTDIVTSYGYDAVGNLTQTTDANGMVTISYYDALGRVTAIAAVASTTLAATAPKQMPVSELRLDAYGNVVVRIDYAAANTATGFTAALGITAGTRALPTPNTAANDRITLTSYDLAGHAIKVTDAEGKIAANSYDVYGRLAKHWQSVTAAAFYGGGQEIAFQINRYDALGRLQKVENAGNVNLVSGAAASNIVQFYSYNAFGEVTARVTGGAASFDADGKVLATNTAVVRSESIEYDNAGHTWRSNAGDGVTRVTMFDAQGNATVVVSSLGTDDPLASAASATEALEKGQLQRTDTRYDLMGRVVDTRQHLESQVHVLVHNPVSGYWENKVLGGAEPKDLTGALMVVGSMGDAGTISVQYRRIGGEWIDQSATRIQTIDGNVVFNLGGLAAGAYDYRITVQPAGESSFVRETGSFVTTPTVGEPVNTALAELYVVLLNRAPDLPGMNHFIQMLNSGATLAQVARDMLGSKEGAPLLSGTGTQLMQRIYLNAFGRSGTSITDDPGYASDVGDWAARYDAAVAAGGNAAGQVLVDMIKYTLHLSIPWPAMRAGVSVVNNRVLAAVRYQLDYRGNNPATASAIFNLAATNIDAALQLVKSAGSEELYSSQIAQAYLTLFGRAPEHSGMVSWMAARRAESMELVVSQMLDSDEARSPGYYPPASSAAEYDRQLITRVYQNVLGRLPTAAELQDGLGIMAQVTDPALRRGRFVMQFADAVASYQGTDPALLAQKQLVNDRLAIALSFSQLDLGSDSLGNIPLELQGDVARQVIAAVSAGATAVDAARQARDTIAANLKMAAAAKAALALAQNATPLETMQRQVAQLYTVLLNRTPDSDGFAFQLKALKDAGGSRAALISMANALLASPESQNDASLAAIRLVNGVKVPLTDAEFVQQVYTLALGALPTSAAATREMSGFISALASKSRGEVALDIIQGMLGYADLPAGEAALKARFNNKVAVSLACAIDLAPFDWANKAQPGIAKQTLLLVTAGDIQAALKYAYEQSQAYLKSMSAAQIASAQAAANALQAMVSAVKDADTASASLAAATAQANAQPSALLRVQIMQLFVGLLGRSAASYKAGNHDLDGFNWQVDAAGKATLDQIAQSMLNSAEAVSIYPSGMTPEDFVARLLNTMLGANHGISSAVIANWVAQMKSPQLLNRGQIALAVLDYVQKFGSYVPDAAAVQLLSAKQGFYQRVADAFAELNAAQQQRARDTADAVAPVTASDTALAALLAAQQSTQKEASAAAQAASSALAAANSAGDASANMRYQLTMLYATLLQRSSAPTLAELNYYISGGGKSSLAAIAHTFINSAEAAQRVVYPADNAQFISKLYSVLLSRPASTDEINFWLPQLLNNTGAPYARGQLALQILNSYNAYSDSATTQLQGKLAFDQKIAGFLADEKAEADRNAAALLSTFKDQDAKTSTAYNTLQTDTATRDSLKTVYDGAAAAAVDGDSVLNLGSSYQQSVTTVYMALRGTMDFAGLAFHMRNLAAGAATVTNLIDALLSAEGYPSDNAQYVKMLYSRVLGRTPNTTEVDFWVGQMTTNGASRATVADAFMKSAEGVQRLTPLVNSRMASDTSNAKALVAARTTAAGKYSAAVEKVNSDTTAYNNYVLSRQTALNNSNAAAQLAAAAAALVTAQAKVVPADQAYVRAAQANDAYLAAKKQNDQLHQTYAAQIDANTAAQLAAAGDRAAAPVTTATAALASARSRIANSAYASQNAPELQRQTEQVTQLYVALLNRGPQLAELKFYTDKLQNRTTTLQAIATALMTSADPAAAALYPANLSNDAFITQLYKFGLRRDFAQDPGGLRFWSDKLSGANPLTRAQLVTNWLSDITAAGNGDSATLDDSVRTALLGVVSEVADAKLPSLQNIILQTESDARQEAVTYDQPATALLTTPAAQSATQLTRLYLGLFNRSPDAPGLAFQLDVRTRGYSMAQIAQGLVASAEGQQFFGSLGNRDFLAWVYNNAMQRQPTDAEIAPYLTQLANVSRAEVALTMLNALADGAAGTLAQAAGRLQFNARVDAAMSEALPGLTLLDKYGDMANKALTAIVSAVPVDLHADGAFYGTSTALMGFINDRQSGQQNQLILDRWGNVLSKNDLRDQNWVVNYTYNDAGQVIRTVQTGAVVDDQGRSSLRTLTSYASYDKLGHVLSTTDAKGYTNKYTYDAQGVLWQEFHADNASATVASVVYANDAFGQHTRVTQNVGLNSAGTAAAAGAVLTDYAYDRLGHVKTKTSAAVNVSYYDGTKEYQGSSAIVETYGYDELGRRISTATATSTAITGIPASVNPTIYTRYDLSGNIISTTDANQLTTKTAYDAFNHKTDVELASHDKQQWEMDGFGRVNSSTDIGNHVTKYEYNASGQLTHQHGKADGQNKVQDLYYEYQDGNGLLARIVDNGAQQITSYDYDLAGNRISEKVMLQQGVRPVQDQKLRYDGFNRLSDIVAAVPAANYKVHYSYDDNGNRTNEKTVFVNDRGDTKTIVANYGYDSMNRENSVSGSTHTKLATKIVVNTPDGKEYRFFDDADIPTHNITYDWRGNRINDNGEIYKYDLAGRLASITGTDSKVSYRRYDVAGRVVFSSDAANDESRLSQYDVGGRLKAQRIANAANSTLRQTVNYTNYDNLNNLLRYTVTLADGKTGQTTDNTYNVKIGGAALLDTTTVHNFNSDSWKSSKQEYDVNGNLAQVQQYDDQYFTRASANGLTTIISDANGHVLEKKQGGLVTHSLIANDQLIGSSNAKMETFSSVYEAADAPSVANQPAVYVVQKDTETLMSVAQTVWGDQRLWYLIADANGGIDTALKAGQQLVIPQRMNTIYNGYLSFTPYNKAEAVGDVAPHLDLPAPQGGGGGGCGAIGKLISVAIAVAVTVMTGGNAVLGNLAAQAFNMATGQQNGFNFKSAALAYVGSEVSDFFKLPGDAASNTAVSWGSDVPAAMARAAVVNATTQAIGSLTGLQSGFSWQNVAAAAVGGGVTESVGAALKGANLISNASLNNFATAAITGFSAGLATAVARGGRVAVVQVATDAFGNALGASLAEQMQRSAEEEAASKKLYSVGGQQAKMGLKTRGGFTFGNVPVEYDSPTISVSSNSVVDDESWDNDEYLIGDPDSPEFAFKPGSAAKRVSNQISPQRVKLPTYDIKGSVSDLPPTTALSQATYDFGTDNEDKIWASLSKLDMRNQPLNSREAVLDVQNALGFSGKELSAYLDLHTLREIRDWKADFGDRKTFEISESLREDSIKPVLRLMGRDTDAMENLLLGVAIHESQQFEYRKQTVGPALGLFQIEPATANDYLRRMELDKSPMLDVMTKLGTGNVEYDLRNNDQYGAAMAAVIFEDRMNRGKVAMPKATDIVGLGQIWKDLYNTRAGKGTVNEFVTDWKRAHRGQK